MTVYDKNKQNKIKKFYLFLFSSCFPMSKDHLLSNKQTAPFGKCTILMEPKHKGFKNLHMTHFFGTLPTPFDNRNLPVPSQRAPLGKITFSCLFGGSTS